MADGSTTNYGLIKPEVGASNNSWGEKTNDNWDDVDALLAENAGDIASLAGSFASHNHDGRYYTETEIDAMAVKLTGSQSIDGVKTFTSTPAVPDASWALAKLVDLAALSVLGRSANSSGVMAALTAGTDGHVLRRLGTALGFGTLAAGAFATGPGILTPAMFDNGSAVSILGRSANSGGVRADIAAGANDTILRRVSDALGFGQITAGMIPSAILTYAMLASSAVAADSDVYSAAASKLLTAAHIESASAPVTLTHGSPTALNWDDGVFRTWTQTANVTLSNPTNGQPGTWRFIRVVGNNTTDRTITFGNQYLNVLPVLTDIDSTRPYLLSIFCFSTSEFYVWADKLRDI